MNRYDNIQVKQSVTQDTAKESVSSTQSAQTWITQFSLQITSFASFHQMAPPLTEMKGM